MGVFQYAFHAATDASHTIRGVTFVPRQLSGAILSHNSETPFGGPNFGASDDDDALENIMNYVIFDSGGPGTLGVTLPNLIVGREYKLQMMFLEACCDRGFDVSIEGNLEVNDFWPGKEQGETDAIGGPYSGGFGGGSGDLGVLITHSFIAADSALDISLVGAAGFPDLNPTLDALTLERIPEPSSFTLLGLGMAAFVLRGRRRR